MFVLDTNVMSELRRARGRKANRNVVRWRISVDTNLLYLSSITVHELEVGILQLERRHAASGEALRNWMKFHVLPSYAGRINVSDFKSTGAKVFNPWGFQC